MTGFTSTTSALRSAFGGPAAGLPVLIPNDGGHDAQLRAHPHAGQPLGEGLVEALSALPAEIDDDVQAACEAGIGLP